jgi:hypothetical protein
VRNDGGLPGKSKMPASRATRCALAVAAGLLSVAVFFRTEIANHFTLLNGDRYDAVIAIAILEHWSNLLRGLAPVAETNFFFPVHGTLGYNDGYFLTGLIDAIFRRLGADPYLAAELVSVVLRAICFAGVYAASRRLLRLDQAFALLAAALATIADNMTVQALHGQLMTVAFVPLMALLMEGAVRAFAAHDKRRFLVLAAIASLFFGAWLLTSFYTAWFFTLFGCLFAAALYALAPVEVRQSTLSTLRAQILSAVAALFFLLLCVCPFLAIYLPKAIETGQHAYLEAFLNLPTIADLFNVGGGNLIFGRFFSNAWTEMEVAIAPGLLVLFGAACVWLRTPHKSGSGDDETRWLIARALCLATLTSYLLILRVGPASAWSVVYVLVPGSHAIRVVSRFQLLLEIPVAVIAAFYLSEHRARFGRPLLALVCALLLLEEINTLPPLHLNRSKEMAFFASIPAAPKNCSAFFVSKARSEGQSGAFVDGVYSHNVDAMFLAETRNLHTVNGFGSFLPPHWNLIDPDRPAYLNDVRAFAAQHGIAGLCSVDLKAKSWDRRL